MGGGKLARGGVVPGSPAERDVRELRKRYRSVDDDLARELRLLDEHGPDPRDDEVRGFGGVVRKRRVRNSDITKGKSGGYRLVYAVLDEGIAVLTIYSKSDAPDVSTDTIHSAIEAMVSLMTEVNNADGCADEIIARHRSE